MSPCACFPTLSILQTDDLDVLTRSHCQSDFRERSFEQSRQKISLVENSQVSHFLTPLPSRAHLMRRHDHGVAELGGLDGTALAAVKELCCSQQNPDANALEQDRVRRLPGPNLLQYWFRVIERLSGCPDPLDCRNGHASPLAEATRSVWFLGSTGEACSVDANNNGACHGACHGTCAACQAPSNPLTL